MTIAAGQPSLSTPGIDFSHGTGYQMIPMRAWIPLGNTSVIRGATRNATVISYQDVELLMIPKEVYLRYWHKLYTPEELLHKAAATRADKTDG